MLTVTFLTVTNKLEGIQYFEVSKMSYLESTTENGIDVVCMGRTYGSGKQYNIEKSRARGSSEQGHPDPNHRRKFVKCSYTYAG